MPTLTIYLADELYESVKDNPSKIIQKSLKEYLKRDVKNEEC